MPVGYVNAVAGKSDLQHADFSDTPPANSPGREFLDECALAGVSPANMNQLNTNFYQFLLGRGWRWDPRTVGASYAAGAQLLDGSATSGECAFPAYALALLINAPAPYGFGIGGAKVVTYKGQHDQGFISNHLQPLPGPQPNITRPQGGTLPAFYCWENHKVVKFNNYCYDPNYNTTYPNKAAMAAVDLQLVRDRVRLRDLADYDPLSPWGVLLAWGLPRLTVLKMSDLAFGTKHHIAVYSAAGGTPAAVGYYIDWGEVWGAPVKFRNTVYGPFTTSPLVR